MMMTTQRMHLRELVRALGWSYGTLWSMPNLTTELVYADGSFEAKPLRRFDSEYFDMERLFTSSYKSCAFQLGSGYVGKVLKEGQPLWLNGTDLLVHHSNTSSQETFFKVAGIQTLLCIPWFNSVIELGSSNLLPQNPDLLSQIHSFLSHMATSTAKQQRTNGFFPIDSSFVSQDLSAGSDDASFNGGQLNRDQQVESRSSLAEISEPSQHRTAAATEIHREAVAGSGDESDWRLEFPELLHPRSLASSQSPSSSFRKQRFQGEVDNEEVNFDSSFLMSPRQQMPLLSQLQYNHSISRSHSSSRADDDTNNFLSASNGSSEQQSDNDQYSPQNGNSNNASGQSTPASGFRRWNATTARDSAMSGGVKRSGSHSNQVVLRRCIDMAAKIPQMNASRERQQRGAEQTNVAAAVRHSTIFAAAEEVLSGHDEAAVNHMLAERRRRQKQKENFTTLRALIPFVTKLDRASILGDAISYVKQLTARVEELELLNHELEAQLPGLQRKRSRSSTITSL